MRRNFKKEIWEIAQMIINEKPIQEKTIIRWNEKWVIVCNSKNDKFIVRKYIIKYDTTSNDVRLVWTWEEYNNLD